MAGTITANSVCAGGNHATCTVTIDGQAVEVTGHVDASPLTTEELRTFVLLSLRRLRASGVTASQLLNRVCVGEEATNVKTYDLLGPGTAVTKTNIGTSYVNISPRLNGERRLVDFTGCTQYRLLASANLVGTGQFGLRVVRDSDNAVLHENANLGASGERELDTDWQTLPAAASGPILVRVQAKSQTGADDPVFGGITLLVR